MDGRRTKNGCKVRPSIYYPITFSCHLMYCDKCDDRNVADNIGDLTVLRKQKTRCQKGKRLEQLANMTRMGDYD